ncbi:MAG: HIT domain-containing protein [Chloroflexi bacterium]|nr:HIT domain-containing protein [Chloroflexota bacterium]
MNGVSPVTFVYADEEIVAFHPHEPEARVHLLLVPRRHIASVDDLREADRELWWHLLRVAQELARREGIDVEGEGYHLVTNAGRHGSRQFPHLHLHLASGAL